MSSAWLGNRWGHETRLKVWRSCIKHWDHTVNRKRAFWRFWAFLAEDFSDIGSFLTGCHFVDHPGMAEAQGCTKDQMTTGQLNLLESGLSASICFNKRKIMCVCVSIWYDVYIMYYLDILYIYIYILCNYLSYDICHMISIIICRLEFHLILNNSTD